MQVRCIIFTLCLHILFQPFVWAEDAGDSSFTGRVSQSSLWHPGGLEYENLTIHEYHDWGAKKRISEYGAKGKLHYIQEFFYDDKGFMIYETKSDHDGTVREKRVFSYDPSGNLVEQVTSDGDGYILSRSVFRYDSTSVFRTEWLLFGEGDELNWHRIYIYDDDGKRLEEHWKDGRGRLSYLYIYTYDDMSNMTGQNVYDGRGRLRWRYVYDYNLANRRIAVKWYDHRNVLQWIRTYRYNNSGNRVEERRYEGHRRLFSREYRYRMVHQFRYRHDDKGRLVEMQVYDGWGKFHYSMSQAFDQHGRLVYYDRSDAFGTRELSYRYAYNDRGLRAAWIWYDKYGNEDLRFVYEYDDAGRLVSEFRYE